MYFDQINVTLSSQTALPCPCSNSMFSFHSPLDPIRVVHFCMATVDIASLKTTGSPYSSDLQLPSLLSQRGGFMSPSFIYA